MSNTEDADRLTTVLGRESEVAQETTPCQPSLRSDTASAWQAPVFGAMMIGLSVLLINFNKFLITGKFPFPMHLVMMHTITGTFFASTLYQFVPSLFPSLSDPLSNVQVDRQLIMGRILPVAVALAAALVLSNVAYAYASVAFLQFMKEGNVVLVYCLSLVVGLESFKWQAFRTLVFIVLSTALCIHGEIHFSIVGFLIQGSSQLFEVSRIVMQAMVLSSAETKLDAMTFVLIVMPVCFVVLLVSMLLVSFLQTKDVLSGEVAPCPGLHDVVDAAPLLFCNAVVAFSLNVSMALFLKSTSPVAYFLAGIVKDCAVVLLSLVLFNESISEYQALGFVLQLCGVLVWSLMKRRPDLFEKLGAVGALRVMLSGDETLRKR